MNDLFVKTTHKDDLYLFIKGRGRCRTSEVIRWGLDNYYTRADRTARELAEEGLIWRMREDLRDMFYDTKEDVWSVYEADR